MYYFSRLKFVLFVAAVLLGVAAGRAADKLPVISHNPVTYAVQGQSLTLKAKVTQDKPGVQAVSLYYALFRDAAPFRVPMKATGLNVYVGTIDSVMIKDVKTIAYYIEAQDMNGATAETPWYNVEFKKADASTPATNETPAAPAGASTDTNSNWATYALIGGGAAAVIGGAVIVANSGSGSGSSGGGATSTNSFAGTYGGTAAKCLTMSGQSPSCESHPVTFQVDSKNAILSADLQPGTPLTANVDSSGNFFMSVPVHGSNFVSGVIDFNGTIVDGQINGQISGSVTTTNSAGVYQGNFNAAKQ